MVRSAPESVAPMNVITQADPGWVGRLSRAERVVLAGLTEAWRPGLTPAESTARAELDEAAIALDTHEPDVAAAAVSRARQALSSQARLQAFTRKVSA